MGETKENILTTALSLFARDGYMAVSVREIAEELGITKGALYRHYRSKRDIFDHIVERMYEIDRERSLSFDMPPDLYTEDPEPYRHTEHESLKAFSLAQYRFWTRDPFAARFRKMLSLEQYRDPEMAELAQQCLIKGPVDYMEDVFREMMAAGKLKAGEPRSLALRFYGPLYLLIAMYDGCGEEDTALLSGHIDSFMETMKA